MRWNVTLAPTKMDVMEDPPFKQLNKLLEYAQYPKTPGSPGRIIAA